MELLDRVRTSVLVAGGAMGTQLQLAGLAIGGGGEGWNVEHPDRVLAIHHAYLAAELSAAAVVGGCCGTGPEHIRALRTLVDSWR
jgi:methionine synthase I (cobalamin-dependent)